MSSVIDIIKNRTVRKWYKENVDPLVLNDIVNRGIEKGYTLNPKTGLLIKEVYSKKTIKKIGHSVIDIIFPRPIDMHHHEDVDGALKIVNGEGVLHVYTNLSERPLNKGDEVYIAKGVSHALRPNKNGFLEIRVTCSGILNPKKEICEMRFDKFPPWVDYYKK